MSKRYSGFQINTPKTSNGGNWYYCHKDTGGKYDGKYNNHNSLECQGAMKRKPIKPKRDQWWR